MFQVTVRSGSAVMAEERRSPRRADRREAGRWGMDMCLGAGGGKSGWFMSDSESFSKVWGSIL